MRILLLLVFLSSCSLYSQAPAIKAAAFKTDWGFSYRVTNAEPVPVSVRLIGTLVNLTASTTLDQVFVVPAHAADFEIVQLRPKTKGKYGYNLRTSYLWGDQRKSDYDKTFLYHLPYAKKSAWRVSQGYHGKSTHQDTYAIDFTMPIGTPVHAARGGVVIQVKQNETKGCTAPECMKKANFIRILHRDGTIAEYTHLKYRGAVVRKGDRVERDQMIGYSGNTGWTTGPHLHFTVYQPRFAKKSRTIPVRFRLERDRVADLLVENRSYRKP
ncbi:M23 family metallopeptidase [Nonlabens xiamenensis]|uniref:M23 family metallopeptidase n=1 Tax=Nonlabens xiamenensis TaxID=2341043 RepID=UPI000F611A37|nr:M23 family metallopeptidase [Nonlabens xiamenensis]